VTAYLVIASVALTLAWLPLAVRFRRGWQTRKNPVSLAICAACIQFAYTNVVFALAVLGQASWEIFAIATHVFSAAVVVNFYFAFRWSDTKFVDARRGGPSYSIPPTNAPNSTRRT
jgi:hypothetical protein